VGLVAILAFTTKKKKMNFLFSQSSYPIILRQAEFGRHLEFYIQQRGKLNE
jgi:hypothetical protein